MEIPSYTLTEDNQFASTFGKHVVVSHSLVAPADRAKQIERLAKAYKIDRPWTCDWLRKLEQSIYNSCTMSIDTKSHFVEGAMPLASKIIWTVEGLDDISEIVVYATKHAGFMTPLEDLACEAFARNVPLENVKIQGLSLKLFMYMAWIEWDTFIWTKTAPDLLRIVQSRPTTMSMPSVSTYNPMIMTKPVPRFNNYLYVASFSALAHHAPKEIKTKVLNGTFTVWALDRKAPPTATVSAAIDDTISSTGAAAGGGGAAEPVIKKGIFHCPKCNSFDVDVVQVQTRSADEGMANMCKCRVCKHQFRRAS